MSEIKITPGTWHADLEGPFLMGGDQIEIVPLDAQGNVCGHICDVWLDTDEYPDGPNFTQQIANVRAIIALPDLIEADEAALQCITDFLECYKNDCARVVMDEAVKSLQNDALLKLRASLDKLNPNSTHD